MSDVTARFWAKVTPAPADQCWLWTAKVARNGYGVFKVNGKSVSAHRWAYESLRTEIPVGLDIDHLCRVRDCVDPWHMEPVTRAVNVLRASMLITHCPRGHDYTADNVILKRHRNGSMTRNCRQCHRDDSRERARRVRAARQPVAA